MKYANPLRLRRIAKGLTQSDVAQAAGISQQLMSKLEAGRIKLGPEKAVVFSDILDCRPAELIPALALTPQPETQTIQELELLVMFRTFSGEQRTILFGLAEIITRQNATDTTEP